MPAIARVEPLTTARALRGPFDYLVPDDLDGVGEGSLLVVPFGHRRVLGVVVAMADHSDVPADKLVAPIEALTLGVPPELVRLAGWMAAAYCSTPARALSLMLPPGAGKGVAPRVRERTGLVAEARAPAEEWGKVTDKQREVLEKLAAEGPLPATATGVGHGTLRRLEKRGLLGLDRRVLPRRPVHASVGARRAEPPRLTADQRAAVAEIERALGAGEGGRYLLHGVTGSGKTEVYLRAAATALEAGRGVIVLVPEIALTPQTVARFIERFGDTVAVLHSQLGQGERHDEWLRLRRGEARVAVGPRSAVLAPVRDLGLVIVDEEHEAAYKNEGDPRYDGRTVAAKRAQDARAVLVAGSATPRPETAHRTRPLRLPERVDGRPLPSVEVLDMCDARHALHAETHDALVDVRRAGGKAIVLLNRRGWSNFLACRACGQVWECPQCDVALVLHRGSGVLACHHCGHRRPAPSRCERCGSPSVARHGAGTERLEHELDEALGDSGFPVFRLDADTTSGRGEAAEVLTRFDRASSGVLLGTQMVAKGHDFPDVTLGVVLDADRTLRFPDFRAEERTFALIAQLAGRAGRGPGGGRVLVQTLAPDAPAILLAARHDADGFLAEELERRRALSYPPFAELIRVVCSAERPGPALDAASAVRDRLAIPGAAVLGPAPLFRLRGRERVQLVVKAPQRGPAVRAVGAAVEAVAAGKLGRRASFSVDVDPQ